MKAYRQSLITSYAACPRRAMHGLAIDDDLSPGNIGASADLGSAMHAVFAEILRTLWRQGERSIPTQEGVEVMYEIIADGPWVLPADEMDDLRALVLSFCAYYEWDTRRILSLEQRLEAEIRCPDGEVRLLTGQPDMVMADPPDGMIVVDWKSSRAVPRSPRTHEKGEPIEGVQYLSERGHGQLDAYGLLALRNYPQPRRVILRELHLRSGEVRQASLGREELEHVERQLGDYMAKLDRAEREGEGSALWRPRPGRHCLRRCPVLASCPIPDEQKGIGALTSPDAANEAAERFIVVDGLRQTLRDQIKAHHEETGHAPDIGDGQVMRWKRDPETGRRSFGVHDPEDPPAPEDTTDYAALLAESVAKVEGESGSPR